MKQPCVYIVVSRRNGTIYTGVTSNLPRRAFEHREGLVKGFSSNYGCKLLVWYELHATMYDAITREKQIKAGSLAKKLALIESLNPDWNDLFETLARPNNRHCEERSDEAIQTAPAEAFWIASRSLSSGRPKGRTRWLAMTE